MEYQLVPRPHSSIERQQRLTDGTSSAPSSSWRPSSAFRCPHLSRTPCCAARRITTGRPVAPRRRRRIRKRSPIPYHTLLKSWAHAPAARRGNCDWLVSLGSPRGAPGPGTWAQWMHATREAPVPVRPPRHDVARYKYSRADHVPHSQLPTATHAPSYTHTLVLATSSHRRLPYLLVLFVLIHDHTSITSSPALVQ
jgi:hypothetical protein